MDPRASALVDAIPGRWIAFSEDESRIVAEGASFEETATAAEKNGEVNAILMLVPPDWSPRIL